MRSPSRRLVASVLATCLTLGLSAISTAPAANAASSSDIGLFGSGDPTYDGVIRQSLALMAYAADGVAPPPESVTWLLKQQCPDGGFQSYRANTSTACLPGDWTNAIGEDTNSTGLAAAALAALGKTTEATSAREWLRPLQSPTDGGFPWFPGKDANGDSPSDANSTAFALLATNAVNILPADVMAPGSTKTAVDYLSSVQIACTSTSADGAFAYADYGTGLSANDTASVQAVLALTGHSLTDVMSTSVQNDNPFVCNGNVPGPFDPVAGGAVYLHSVLDTNSNAIPLLDFSTGLYTAGSVEPADTATAVLALASAGVDPSTLQESLTIVGQKSAAAPDNPALKAMYALALHATGASDSVIHPVLAQITATLKPHNSSAPKISGAINAGSTVSCSAGTWTQNPTLKYKWVRSGSTATIATTPTLKITTAMVGKRLTCTITATRGHAVTTVSTSTLANTVRPISIGAKTVGTLLTAKVGSWSPAPTSYRYVWKLGSVVVGTAATYRVKAQDRGGRLRLYVTAYRTGYSPTTVFSMYRTIV